MANAKGDDNRIPLLLATLNTDGVTPQPVNVDPFSHAISSNIGTTGTGFSTTGTRDQNRVTGMYGVSSADGITLVEIYANSSGELLMDQT